MFAGVVHKPFDIRYERIPTPTLLEGEVLVKVKYTGICGSDVPRVNGNACRTYPMVLGHEFAGTIVSIGEGVTRHYIGERVAGIPLIPCLECEDCKKGDYSLCKNYSFVGSRRFGSFAEYVVLPEENVVSIGETEFEVAAFIEPATVALHGLRCAKYESGKRVAIIGAGTVGTLLLQLCVIHGAKEIVMLNHSTKKLERSMKYGAHHGIDTSKDDYLEKVRAATDGRGFDYVFETAGSAETIRIAFEIAANHASICMIGTPKGEVEFSVEEWELLNRKEMYVTGSWMSYSKPFPGSEWTDVASYFNSGKLKIDKSLIFRTIPLSKIDEAFKLYEIPGAVKGKILIDSEI